VYETLIWNLRRQVTGRLSLKKYEKLLVREPTLSFRSLNREFPFCSSSDISVKLKYLYPFISTKLKPLVRNVFSFKLALFPNSVIQHSWKLGTGRDIFKKKVLNSFRHSSLRSNFMWSGSLLNNTSIQRHGGDEK
jgi:hypothetical protein